MNKNNKKPLFITLIIMFILLALWILVPIIIFNIRNTKAEEETKKEEEQAMLDAMECWSDGKEYNGYCGVWDYKEYDEIKKIEEKAIEIVKSLKDKPSNLAFFLTNLERKGLKSSNINIELSNLDFSFEEKILLKSEAIIIYYSLPQITKSEAETYIDQHEKKELHLTAGTGGFYDGKENTSYNNRIGGEGSPLYNAESTAYFGDFKSTHRHGVKLNDRYQEESYSHLSHYFKDHSINFDPLAFDRVYYCEKYLLAIDSNMMCVYDTETHDGCKYIFTN